MKALHIHYRLIPVILLLTITISGFTQTRVVLNVTQEDLSACVEETTPANHLENFPGHTLYPNPVEDEINLILTEQDKSSPFKLKIMSITGQVVNEYLIKNYAGSHHKIDASHLSKGIYFLHVNIQQHTEVIKFVKK
ncbi:MAG: T9SS type A sorting domain-containing protein [bacterium]